MAAAINIFVFVLVFVFHRVADFYCRGFKQTHQNERAALLECPDRSQPVFQQTVRGVF
jgi:hypothetical protein